MSDQSHTHRSDGFDYGNGVTESSVSSFPFAANPSNSLAGPNTSWSMTPEWDTLSLQTERLKIAFDNIREGLVMYDADERVVMMNRRYAELYQIPKELQSPGTTFSKLLAYWKDIGLLDSRQSREVRTVIDASKTGGRFQLDLMDGRTYELNEQFLPGGGWVSTHEDITDRVTAERQIRYLAEHDPLTGLFNRAVFNERLADMIVAANGAPTTARGTLLMLDLDRFKPVNDLHGHSAGDQVLVEVADRIRHVCDRDQMIARLGGDEFAILFGTADRDHLATIAERLITAICQPIELGRTRLQLGASIGIAHLPDHGRTSSDLLKCADRALYAAKHDANRSIVTYVTDLDCDELARSELIRRLPAAMQTGEIELHFQPIIDSATGICHAGEALLRWTHPTQGRLSPELVIALAEESRQINQLGDWILRRALATARTWPEHISIAVNLSATQFNDPSFKQRVIDALRTSGVAPRRLELELTETVLCSPEATATISALRDIGVRFSLDDFGTGYASMSYLLQFPFDRVKIDRSFVTDVNERSDRRLIVEAVANLATKLGLEIVAEGVETSAEREVVSSAGCRFLQGYLFARPLQADAFSAFIAGTSAQTSAA